MSPAERLQSLARADATGSTRQWAANLAAAVEKWNTALDEDTGNIPPPFPDTRPGNAERELLGMLRGVPVERTGAVRGVFVARDDVLDLIACGVTWVRNDVLFTFFRDTLVALPDEEIVSFVERRYRSEEARTQHYIRDTLRAFRAKYLGGS